MAQAHDALFFGDFSRPPILIDGNAAFTPLNGVTSGTGTALDPYIISGWIIDFQEWRRLDLIAPSSTAISIARTTAHVIVRDNHVNDYARGIAVSNASNVRIEGNTITSRAAPSEISVTVDNAQDVRLTSNSVTNSFATAKWTGVQITSSARVNVTSNTFSNNANVGDTSGIFARTSTGLTVRTNLVEQRAISARDHVAYRFTFLERSLIESNTMSAVAAQGASSGFIVEDSFANTLRSNVASTATYQGFVSRRSQSDAWIGNVASGALHGVVINMSRGEFFDGNVISANRWSLALQGGDLADFIHDIRDSNRIEGRPTMYRVGLRNVVIDGANAHVGWLGIVDARNVTIRNFNASASGYQGVILAAFHDSRLENVASYSNHRGFEILHSTNCRVTNARGTALFMRDTFACAIEGSRFTRDTSEQQWSARVGPRSSYTTITNTTITSAILGLEFASGPGNVLLRSTVTGNSIGIFVRASGNQVHDSTISGNAAGVHVEFVSFNATQNWWGAANGPGGRFPGSGDTVNWVAGVVTVAPWLTSPP